MPPKKIAKLAPEEAAGALREHLARYVELALAEGAADARVIPAGDIVVDDRVPVKCWIPQCSVYGQSYNCPPNTMRPDETRRLVAQYEWAVTFKVDVPPDVIVWEQATAPDRSKAYRSVTLIANAVESAAFYDGHYFSVGFGAGSCKTAFCREVDCLAIKGEECRISLRARPSMEAVGMDVFKMAVDLGWDIYPVGSGAESENVTMGMMMGLVLVG